jgi:hypothetical protein
VRNLWRLLRGNIVGDCYAGILHRGADLGKDTGSQNMDLGWFCLERSCRRFFKMSCRVRRANLILLKRDTWYETPMTGIKAKCSTILMQNRHVRFLHHFLHKTGQKGHFKKSTGTYATVTVIFWTNKPDLVYVAVG